MKIFKFKSKTPVEEKMEFNKRQNEEKLAFYLPDNEFIPIAKIFARRYYNDELITRLADFFEKSETIIAIKLFNTGLIQTI